MVIITLASSSPLLYVNSQSYRYPFRLSSRLCFLLLSAFITVQIRIHNIIYVIVSIIRYYLVKGSVHGRFSSHQINIDFERPIWYYCGNRRFSSFDYWQGFFKALHCCCSVLVQRIYIYIYMREHETERANQHKLCKSCKQKHETKNIKRWCMIVVMIYMRAARIKVLYDRCFEMFLHHQIIPCPYYH